MAEIIVRPKLTSFRVVSFSSENRHEAAGTRWELKIDQTSELGIGVPTVPGGVIQAVVKITMHAQAHNEQAPDQKADFKAEYLGKFDCPPDVKEDMLSTWVESEPNQYSLVSQVFPLAMSHFRRELQSTGFDGRALPLGL
jgi:hypothetical protein